MIIGSMWNFWQKNAAGRWSRIVPSGRGRFRRCRWHLLLRWRPANTAADTKVKRYSAEFYQKLQDVLYENRILPSVYLLYCYGKCLCRFSGTDALSVSMTVSERSPMQHVFSDVIGDFTKLLLVDLESGGTQPWTEVCRG